MCGEYDNLWEGSLYFFRNYLILNVRYFIIFVLVLWGLDFVFKEYVILYYFLDFKINLIFVVYFFKLDFFFWGL